jgi:hypothetical protein
VQGHRTEGPEDVLTQTTTSVNERLQGVPKELGLRDEESRPSPTSKSSDSVLKCRRRKRRASGVDSDANIASIFRRRSSRRVLERG